MMIRVDDETAARLERVRAETGATSPTEAVRLLVAAASEDGTVRAAAAAQREGGVAARAYLQGLRWDGVERLRTAAEQLLGAGGAEAAEGFRAWCLSAVARALEPGVRVDRSLLLVGAQGTGKSSLLRALAGERFYADGERDPGRDAWIVEMPVETDDVPAAKGFLVATHDVVRRGARRARPFVVVGTAQVDAELGRPRRWWVVRVGAAGCDVDKARAWRDQLWAEAVAAQGG